MSKRILPKLWAACMAYLGTLPLFLLPASALIPETVWVAALLPVPALAFTLWAGWQPANKRVFMLSIGIAAMAAACAVLFIPGRPLALLLFLPCLFLMLFFMPAMARPAHLEWPPSSLGFGIIVHGITQLLKGLALFSGVAAAVSWAFAAYLVASLFTFNRSVLMDSNASTSKPLLSFNRGMLTVFCLLALLLANIRSVAMAIRAAVLWLVRAIIFAALWLASLFGQGETVTGGDGGGGPSLAGLAEATEPSLLSKIMEIVLLVLAAAASLVLLYWAGKRLYRLLKKLYQALRERMQAYRRKISADYSDQSESLLDWGEVRKAAQNRMERFKQRYLPAAWEKLSPALRVRRIYAILLRKPATPDPALTAQEMLQSGSFKLAPEDAAALAALYDQARYSDHPITAAEADQLRKRTGV